MMNNDFPDWEDLINRCDNLGKLSFDLADEAEKRNFLSEHNRSDLEWVAETREIATSALFDVAQAIRDITNDFLSHLETFEIESMPVMTSHTQTIVRDLSLTQKRSDMHRIDQQCTRRTFAPRQTQKFVQISPEPLHFPGPLTRDVLDQIGHGVRSVSSYEAESLTAARRPSTARDSRIQHHTTSAATRAGQPRRQYGQGNSRNALNAIGGGSSQSFRSTSGSMGSGVNVAASSGSDSPSGSSSSVNQPRGHGSGSASDVRATPPVPRPPSTPHQNVPNFPQPPAEEPQDDVYDVPKFDEGVKAFSAGEQAVLLAEYNDEPNGVLFEAGSLVTVGDSDFNYSECTTQLGAQGVVPTSWLQPAAH